MNAHPGEVQGKEEGKKGRDVFGSLSKIGEHDVHTVGF